MAIIHCKEHQKGNTVQETGDKMVDQVAEQVLKRALIPDRQLKISEPESKPVKYLQEDSNLIHHLEGKRAG